ncbi:uncharacterized protein A4U43_UnF11140 [Asparagus officinalis]|uniref:Uncharacterized protein n=1 Tax=Asparagus officinalis TaxID=4686 RepID=A0A1R3L5A7_ASPOF|nr:uncharacterized protein A4U43_UnF11140 [Asparagus officinalis]
MKFRILLSVIQRRHYQKLLKIRLATRHWQIFAVQQKLQWSLAGVLVSLRMALDDLSGVTGENVGQLPEYLEDAMKAAYNRYMTYLGSFGPDEAYLRKKVESELGTKMIRIKMRCSGIGSEWGKVTLLGTSSISGSYVEQRA